MVNDDFTNAYAIKRRSFLAAGLAALALPVIGKTLGHGPDPDDFDAFIGSAMRSANIPGLAVGFAREGKVRDRKSVV